jgi:flagellar biosynthesis protein FlhG
MAKIIPVASGKGGVGKSFFVANLSIILSEMNQKVIAVDLDLGGSNLHTLLGIKNDIIGLGHFINGKVESFSEIIHATEYPNLSFVPGDGLFLGTANLPYFKKRKIISELTKLDADWIILDLGSGSTANTIDFFLVSNCGILVTTPEITAVLNLYTFLKNSFFRYIIQSFKKKDPVRIRLMEASKMRLEKEDLRFFEFIRLLKKDFPGDEAKIDGIINNFFPKLILNMGNSERDIMFGENLRSIIHKNLGLDVEYLGLLPVEEQARECILARKPVCVLNKESKWVENLKKTATRLLEFHNYPVTIFNDDIDSLDVVYEDLQAVSQDEGVTDNKS